jgi:hypothetical protein
VPLISLRIIQANLNLDVTLAFLAIPKVMLLVRVATSGRWAGSRTSCTPKGG